MTLEEGKQKFLQSWGIHGSSWGVNRTMAQVHALLLISSEPLSADEIMNELKISRGNANMNIRALIDWGLVFKELKAGHRKEFFTAEKDMYRVMQCIVEQRKKRELEPMIKALNELSAVDQTEKGAQCFTKVIDDIKSFSLKADAVLDRICNSKPNWFMDTFLKIVMKKKC